MSNQNTGITGIIPPLVTPLTENYIFDAEAYQRLIDHVIRGGVSGIFILGTNGECANLTNEMRNKAIPVAVAAAGGRVPVFVNVSTSSFKESMKLSEVAAGEGADYIVISPPYYFDMNQDELYKYFDIIAGSSSLPVFLYNAPQYTKIEITLDTVLKLVSHENVLGLKDSSGDINYLGKVLKARGNTDFKVYVGTELLLGESILMGGDGGINGGANIFPELYVKMYQAVLNRNVEEQKKLQEIMQGLKSHIYDVHQSSMGIIIGLKYSLSVLGICSDTMAMPVYSKLNSEQKKTIEDFVNGFQKYAI